MTTEPHQAQWAGTTLTTRPGAGRSPARRHRVPAGGLAASSTPLGPRGARVFLLALSAAIALGTACSRQNVPNIDPGIKSWFEGSYRPAVDDMSKAAGAAKTVQEGCQAASDALVTHETKLTNTPDPQLSQLIREFIDERKAEYAKCVETGTTPAPSAKIPEIQRRVNELTARGREG